MAILRGMDGKFYDVPDEEAHKFEVPREKVKELLSKAGGPPGGGGPGGGGPGGGPGRPGPHGGQPYAPVVIQVFPPPGGGGAPYGSGAPSPGGGPEGEVDPYWWWWNNYWGNY